MAKEDRKRDDWRARDAEPPGWVAAHTSLFHAYRLDLSRELSELTRGGSDLADCVAILIRTGYEADVARIVSRAEAREIAEVAGMDSALSEPPRAPRLHVFTFAANAVSVRTVLVQPLTAGGKA
jgi:hypothetical protein